MRQRRFSARWVFNGRPRIMVWSLTESSSLQDYYSLSEVCLTRSKYERRYMKRFVYDRTMLNTLSISETKTQNINVIMLKSHNLILFSHKPQCTVILNSNSTILKAPNCFQLEWKNFSSLLYSVKKKGRRYLALLRNWPKFHLLTKIVKYKWNFLDQHPLTYRFCGSGM